MKAKGLPQNTGQAMFPTDTEERLVWILQQQEMKMSEAVNVTLILNPIPKNYDVSEDDILNSMKLWIKAEDYRTPTSATWSPGQGRKDTPSS